MTAPELVLDGDLDLLGANISPEGVRFTLEASGEDATTGSPAPIDETIQRWLRDGAIVTSQGYDNRELYFRVKIEGPTVNALTAGEAALVARSGRRTTLTWVPPVGRERAPATVFEVETMHLEADFDDLSERRLERFFGVRMTALPWVRAEELTVTEALPVSAAPTVTLVDDCTSLTGWTGTPNAPTIASGAVRESQTVSISPRVGTSTYTNSLTRTGTVAVPVGAEYLQLDATINMPSGLVTPTYNLRPSLDGQPLLQVASNGNVSWWRLPDDMTSWDDLTVTGSATFSNRGSFGTVTIRLDVKDVSLTNVPALAGTGRTSLRSIDVGGTVHTYGSIHVASPSGGLGKVLVHTAPDCRCGYSPAMRPFRTSGGTVSTDSTTMSGAREPIQNTNTVRFDVPASQLPAGDYVLIARAKAAAVEDVDIEVGTTVGTLTPEVQTARVSFTVADTYQWCILGKYRLPPVALPGEALATLVGITLHAVTSTTVTLDDLYVLAYSDNPRKGGTITLVDAGAATHLWIDSPDGDDRLPHYYAGTQADRSDAVGIDHTDAVQAFGAHVFDPAGSTVFLATEGATLATMDFTHYRRGHSNIGQA